MTKLKEAIDRFIHRLIYAKGARPGQVPPKAPPKYHGHIPPRAMPEPRSVDSISEKKEAA